MTTTPPLRIMVVDDHDVIRRGLEMCFQLFDELEYVGGAANGLEAIDTCGELPPDLVLMDIMMPKMDGIEATRRIHAQWPNIRIIAFTSLNDEVESRRMLDAGAVTVIMKVMGVDELRDAILQAFALPYPAAS